MSYKSFTPYYKAVPHKGAKVFDCLIGGLLVTLFDDSPLKTESQPPKDSGDNKIDKELRLHLICHRLLQCRNYKYVILRKRLLIGSTLKI
jgi:hypothetical protein